MADPVYIIPDSPVSERADFGFSAYIDTIADLIAYGKNKTPLVIGVYGKWGSGKTTLMRSIEHQLTTKTAYQKPPFRNCRPVWFQAWKYKAEDEILAALLEQIFATMARDDFFTRCRAQIETLVSSLNPGKALRALIKNITAADVSGFFQEMDYKQKLGFYDEFEAFFKRLIWTYLSGRPQIQSSETYDDSKGILTIFIDDLDRCPRNRIVGVLETVKLFMDIPGCVFIIGADNEIIIQALESTYHQNADRFMDKIVQVTFNLPRIPDEDFAPHLDKILSETGQDEDPYLKEYLPILLPVLGNNPRAFKRFLNDLSLQKGLITHKELEVTPKHLLLFNLFEKGFRAFYLVLRADGGHRALDAVHKILDTAKQKEVPLESIGTEGIGIPVPDSVAQFIKDLRLLDLIDRFRPGKQGLERLVTLTGIVKSPKKEAAKSKSAPGETHKRVLIPAGTFIYQDGEKRSIDYDYEMDIYPVTNEQFERFIADGGYSNKDFWSDEGWKQREKDNWENPWLWKDPDYNTPEQPVVGVSWYEAEAYGKWLTGFKSDGYTYRLPSEEEWERVARGDEGNIYPWGNYFSEDRCNGEKSGIGKPNRVSVYPNGVSPYGCYDMAGNVWEWTSSFYDKDLGAYVLRGGAFTSGADGCRCTARFNNGPVFRNGGVGFRCARIKL